MEHETLFHRPQQATALLLLAHGAGAGMRHPFLEALAGALHEQGVATLRYEFPYMAAGRKRPDPPRVAMATVQAAVAEGRAAAPDLPLFAGGKSFGSRMSTMAAAAGLLPEVRGLVCFGFPLHAAKKPALERAGHLAQVSVPLLFLQGTRDALAETDLMRQVAQGLPHATLHIVAGADHGFAVPKASGRSTEAVLTELAATAAGFMRAKGVP